jgi:hypothetical protein
MNATDRLKLLRLASEHPAMSPERRALIAAAGGYRSLPAAVRGTEPNVDPEGTDLSIWTWEENIRGRETYLAIAFQGESGKPLWYYTYSNPERRASQIKASIESRKSSIEHKNLKRQKRKEFQHGLKPGDILYASWGFDQTNVDFYEVVAVAGKSVAIREVESRVLSSSGYGQDKVVPVPGRYTGPAMKKIPTVGYQNQPSIKITSYSSARLWDGKPKEATSFGWGR